MQSLQRDKIGVPLFGLECRPMFSFTVHQYHSVFQYVETLRQPAHSLSFIHSQLFISLHYTEVCTVCPGTSPKPYFGRRPRSYALSVIRRVLAVPGLSVQTSVRLYIQALILLVSIFDRIGMSTTHYLITGANRGKHPKRKHERDFSHSDTNI